MHENAIKFWYLFFATIVLAISLMYNQYELAMVTVIMGFIVASA
jgi:hypothetical protein